MKDKCNKLGRHAYISSQPKPRWCLWCNHKEDSKPTPRKKSPKKLTKKK